MAAIDLMIFDIQDVGARFYTYINTLGHVMEACAETIRKCSSLTVPIRMVSWWTALILEDHLHSGIGMYKIPISHGLTIAEFAQMINGEGWLPNKMQCSLKIIKVAELHP
jgi:uncharacterized protein YbbC (DUF1343 family)